LAGIISSSHIMSIINKEYKHQSKMKTERFRSLSKAEIMSSMTFLHFGHPVLKMDRCLDVKDDKERPVLAPKKMQFYSLYDFLTKF